MKRAPTIRVSKLDAARRQLDTAIELWFADGDEVSIHTLVAAAHQVIHDINRKKGGKELLFDSAKIKDEHRSEFVSLIKRDMNFFKHADQDAEQIIEFVPLTSILFMMFSIVGLEHLGERLNDTENDLILWLTFHHPNWMTESYRKFVAERIPVDQLDEIRSLSKSDFHQGLLRLRAKAKYEGRRL